jgi:NAD(P) transhydrogenase
MLLATRQNSIYVGRFRFQLRKLSSSANGKKYNELTLGLPREIYEGETRVALTPASCATLIQKGLKVRVEENAGALASFQNKDYEQAGAEVVGTKQAFENDILFKIRPPKLHEVEQIPQYGTLISFIQPSHNADLIKQLEKRQVTALGMELIPRVSRAQVFDALSSMANIAGYKAVVEAANHFGRFFGGQITAAGKVNYVILDSNLVD